MKFPEEFLHFIWRLRLFNAQELYGAANESIKIIQQGSLNTNAGPDFLHAKLLIDQTTWVGNIEIHINSSDWLLHQHQFDAAYDNVILHVVYCYDKPIYRTDGTLIPTLVLKDRFPEQLLVQYQQLMVGNYRFPCEKLIHNIDQFLIDHFLTRLAIERLELKAQEVYSVLNELKGDWDETFYHFMAKNFGLKLNSIPMEMLTRSLPQHILARHKDSALQVEALLFGQAGFLTRKFKDDYPNELKREYEFLSRKYDLKPLSVSIWKFMRMRPQNFPTLRLAQFAALVHKSNHLFSKVLTLKNTDIVSKLFMHLPVHNYWKDHFHFGKSAANVKPQLGKNTIQNILVNTVSLFLFAYGKYIGQRVLIDRAIALQENLPAEGNAILNQYLNAGVKISSSFHSQGLLQLKKMYCNEKKCLNCVIGIKILKK